MKKRLFKKKKKTVGEYIKDHPFALTGRRYSPRGEEVVEVTYRTGVTVEYPTRQLSVEMALEY